MPMIAMTKARIVAAADGQDDADDRHDEGKNRCSPAGPHMHLPSRREFVTDRRSRTFHELSCIESRISADFGGRSSFTAG